VSSAPASTGRSSTWSTAGRTTGDGCGNMYVLITHGPLTGKVAFIETTTDPDRIDYLVASDLWHFLRFLLARETGERGWPFHAAFVQSIDPHLTDSTDLLPWHT
jgi:hypothetical protein